MGPNDYSVDAKDPAQTLMQGFQFGQGIHAAQVQRQEEERKRLAQAAMQEDFNKVTADPSAENINKLALKYPALSENFKRVSEMMDATKKEQVISQGTQIYSALSAGRADIAADIVKQSIEAHKNSGNVAEQRTAELLLKQIEAAPEVAMTTTGLMLEHAMGGKFAESFAKQAEEKRKAALFDPEQAKEKQTLELKKLAADYDLTIAQTNEAILRGKKVSAELPKLLMEAESLRKTGGMDPTKKFDLEDKVRKEYNSRTGKFTELRGTYDVIKASSVDKSGAGDIALVTSFMKMLDPTSVVRETEFANARDTSGLLQKLQNQAQKLQSGAFLDDTQRQSFVRLAGQYMKAAEEHEKRTRAGLEKTVKSYNLDPENVFGSVESPPSPVPPPAASAAPAAGAPSVAEKTLSILQKYPPKQ
ncbi:MAG: hypothetical protein WC736_15670 [Gallionella sp.]|jgi:hypothetical protein